MVRSSQGAEGCWNIRTAVQYDAHGGLGRQEREDFPGLHKVPAELAPSRGGRATRVDGRRARAAVTRRGGAEVTPPAYSRLTKKRDLINYMYMYYM